jgi:hypothetical protein
LGLFGVDLIEELILEEVLLRTTDTAEGDCCVSEAYLLLADVH